MNLLDEVASMAGCTERSNFLHTIKTALCRNMLKLIFCKRIAARSTVITQAKVV